MAKDKRWIPVRDGNIYCSPACGFKCTIHAYDRAVANAAELALHLGEPFRPTVWENGDWFYCAEYHDKGNQFQVFPRDGQLYWVNMKLDGITQLSGIYQDAMVGIQDLKNQMSKIINEAMARLALL